MNTKEMLDRMNFKSLTLIEKYGVKLFFKPISFKKNEIITRLGQVEQRVYHILKGAVRVFILDSNNEEETFEIFCSGEFVTSFVSLKYKQPSGVTIQAVSDVQAVYLTRTKYEFLKKIIGNLEKGLLRLWKTCL